MDVELQLSTNAVALPKVTEPLPWLMLKFVPEIVTDVPVVPELAEIDEIAGVGTLVESENFARYESLDPLRKV